MQVTIETLNLYDDEFIIDTEFVSINLDEKTIELNSADLFQLSDEDFHLILSEYYYHIESELEKLFESIDIYDYNYEGNKLKEIMELTFKY